MSGSETLVVSRASAMRQTVPDTVPHPNCWDPYDARPRWWSSYPIQQRSSGGGGGGAAAASLLLDARTWMRPGPSILTQAHDGGGWW